MTDRDEFAKAAMTGLLARYGTDGGLESAAECAYMFADAMLKARSSVEPATPEAKPVPVECERCRKLEAENKRLRAIIDSGIGPEDWGNPSENKQENLP